MGFPKVCTKHFRIVVCSNFHCSNQLLHDSSWHPTIDDIRNDGRISSLCSWSQRVQCTATWIFQGLPQPPRIHTPLEDCPQEGRKRSGAQKGGPKHRGRGKKRQIFGLAEEVLRKGRGGPAWVLSPNPLPSLFSPSKMPKIDPKLTVANVGETVAKTGREKEKLLAVGKAVSICNFDYDCYCRLELL